MMAFNFGITWPFVQDHILHMTLINKYTDRGDWNGTKGYDPLCFSEEGFSSCLVP